MNSSAKGAEKILSMENGQILKPLDALIPNIPFFMFCRIVLRGTGVSLGRILGIPSIEPFFSGGKGSSQRAVSTPGPGSSKPAHPFKRKPAFPQGVRAPNYFGGGSYMVQSPIRSVQCIAVEEPPPPGVGG